MRSRTALVTVLAQLGIIAAGAVGPFGPLPLALHPSAFILTSMTGFGGLADGISKKGKNARAPAVIVGSSGVKHEFAFAITPESKKPKVVVDTELSVEDVDDTKVLKFYVKVFDVQPEKAILCVTPKLSERAAALAREYGIEVLEDEVPRRLVERAAEVINGAKGIGSD